MSTETVNPFLTWAPPGQPVVVQIDHGTMDRMNIEVMRGFGVTRRRGTETGGVLLGQIDRRAKTPLIYISDFEVVPCEYASGPSYVLSANDERRFKEAVAKWQPSLDRESYAVGYFRSHTREGFALDERDASVVREFFPDPLDVALLVKPFATRPAIAGFFLKEKGSLVTASTPLEFKFETPRKAVADPVAQPQATQPKPSAASTTPAKPPISTAASRPQLVQPRPEAAPERDLFTAQVVPTSRWPRVLSWAGFCLALLAFGGACGYEYAGRQVQGQRGQANQAGLPNSDLYAIQLQATKSGNGVIVRWNRDAAAVQAALHGILTVTEGANSKDVKLGFAELRNGTALYPLIAPGLRFRLEIFFKDNRSFVESAVYTEFSQ